MQFLHSAPPIIPAFILAALLPFASARAAEITVNSTADPVGFNPAITIAQLGATVTLRDAVNAANNTAGDDAIAFHPSLAGQTITLTHLGSFQTALPVMNNFNGIVQKLTIQGLPGSNGIAIARGGTNEMRIFRLLDSNSLSLNDLTIRDGNLPDGLGGAVQLVTGELNINRCTLINNRARLGGALYHDAQGIATLTNCTIYNNTAGEQGGGIYLATGSQATLTNVTLTGNHAIQGGGIHINGSPGPLLVNTIVANNNASLNLPEFRGIVSSESHHNLTSDPGTFIAIFNGAGNMSNGVNNNLLGVNPLLGPLANNGGPTMTMALLTGSPAINAGVTVAGVTTDQRGVARPQGATPDIGAFELVFTPSLMVTTAVDEDNGHSDPGLGTGTSLREAVAYANSRPGADTITFAPELAGQTIALVGGQLELTETGAANRTTITGPVGGITISGGQTTRVFRVNTAVLATFDGLTLADGSADSGGAINNSGNLIITNCLFRENAANLVSGSGGAIAHGGGGTLDILNTVFQLNEAFLGGAINSSNNLSISDSTFSGNTVTFNGGALRLFGTSSITRSTFHDNAATNGGGGLISHGTTTVVNTTFTGNTARDGAGLQAWEQPLELRHVTITANTATRSGGGMAVNPGTTTMTNTIVAANVAVEHSPDISGNFQGASAHNLIGTGGTGGLTDGVNGNLVGITYPGLGSLADNGGPTLTIALLSGSPAINAGIVISGVNFDQRGFARIVGPAPDIGAFESTSLGSLPDWRALHGLASDGSQDLQSAANNGVVNLLKYAFNMAPNAGDLLVPNLTILDPVAGTTGLPAIRPDDQGRLVITFIRRKAATNPGILYEVLTGDDLADLQPLDISGAVVESFDFAWERVTATDPAANEKRFGRLRVTVSP